MVSTRQLSKAACLSPFRRRQHPTPTHHGARICRIDGLATLATAIQQLSQSAAAKPRVFSTCRGTVRPKNPAASTTAKITTAIIFFIRSFPLSTQTRRSIFTAICETNTLHWQRIRKPRRFSPLSQFGLCYHGQQAQAVSLFIADMLAARRQGNALRPRAERTKKTGETEEN
jgi:hypothetical protein